MLLHQRDGMVLSAAVAKMAIEFFGMLVVLIKQCVLLTLNHDKIMIICFLSLSN